MSRWDEISTETFRGGSTLAGSRRIVFSGNCLRLFFWGQIPSLLTAISDVNLLY